LGEAGDCYSTANCPQGRFGIDLTGTGLRVSPYTGWVGQGNRPSLWLKRESVRPQALLLLLSTVALTQ
jgi:hypothetical protein